MIILCADQEWNSGLIEPSTLSVPFLDAVEGTLPGQIKHEQNCNGIIADER